MNLNLRVLYDCNQLLVEADIHHVDNIIEVSVTREYICEF